MKFLLLSSESDNLKVSEAKKAFNLLLLKAGYLPAETEKEARLIIAFSRESLLFAKSLKKETGALLYYYFPQSEANLNFDLDVGEIDKVLIGQDSNVKILFPWQSLAVKIPIPFFENPFTHSECDTDIFVYTSENMCPDSALIKIVRTLNRLTQYNIKVMSNNDGLQSVFNPNVEVIKISSELSNYIANTRIVIGAGYAAMYALLFRKPLVVVGERGYGGIPTVNNLQLFYNEFFQGTIGGRFDGPVPEQLLYEDIMHIFQSGKCPDEDLTYRFSEIIAKKQISSVAFTNTGAYSQGQSCRYKLNPDFTLIKAPNGTFWVLNRYTRTIFYKLDGAHAQVLLDIANSNSSFSGKNEKEIIISLLQKGIIKDIH